MNRIRFELAEICGIHAGDGYLRLRTGNKGEVDISGSVEEKDYYDAHVIPLFNRVFNLNLAGKLFSRGTYGFVSYQKEVRNLLMKLGLPKGKKSKMVKVPKSVLDSKNKKVYSAFLRGLFDTDGNLSFRKSYKNLDKFKNRYHHYPTLSITTTSKSLSRRNH